MLPRNHPDRIQITFDDRRLVANAGLLLPATLARHLGLPELVRQRLDLGDAPGRANTSDKMMTLVASALAGGDCIDDADVLRTGGTACTLGGTVKAPSTLGTFLRSFRWGHVRQLDRVSRELLARGPSVSFGGFGLTLDVVVASTTPDGAALVNTVVAESAQIDVNLSDNTATTTSTVEVLKVDLEITKQADVDPVVAGEQLTYTITVTNSALTPATGVRVVEALPPQVSFVSGVTSQGDYDSDTQVWTIGDLGSGQDAQLSLEVLVASTTPDGAALVNSASVTSDPSGFGPV